MMLSSKSSKRKSRKRTSDENESEQFKIIPISALSNDYSMSSEMEIMKKAKKTMKKAKKTMKKAKNVKPTEDPTKLNDNCKDMDEKCHKWLLKGYCLHPKHSKFMETRCPQSCQLRKCQLNKRKT